MSAVHRRTEFELGLTLEDLTVMIPDFRYRAEQDGIVENEICPVTAARANDRSPRPHPAETDDWRWIPWEEVGALIDRERPAMSPWFVAQHDLLTQNGWSPTALDREGSQHH